MANGHAIDLNKAANLAPPQTMRLPLLMNDIQCLALMAAHHGGTPQEAVEWSIETLARIVVAVQRGKINAAVSQQAENETAQKES